MVTEPERDALSKDERMAREVLMGTNRGLRFGRRVFRTLPGGRRCKLCTSPFGSAGGALMRAMGKGPWPNNPKYCSACFKQISEHRTGAEIECSLLFADVRNSTSMAEAMRPTEFRALMNRFFEAASRALIDHEAVVDKFVGDEIIGIFIPALTGGRHAASAVAAARALVGATRNRDGTAWVPVGAGVHTGVAYVGTVGDGAHVDFTAMGDPVNVTARLASAAGAGEVLVTTAAASAAGVTDVGLEHRELRLKGKTATTEVVVLHAA